MITIVICCLLIQYWPFILAAYALIMFLIGLLNG